MLRLPRLAGAATAALALGALAAAPAASGEPIVSAPRIVAHFDLAAGQTPENIALEPDGSADLTFAFARQVAHVTRFGQVRVRATLPAEPHPNTPLIGSAIVTGIARAHDGTLYVAYATGTSRTGIWRIAPDGRAPRQIAQLPPDGLPNGLALDEHRGVLYAADSVRGVVWRVPQAGGRPTVWAGGPALAPLPPPAAGFGANGIKVRHDAVWVTNTDRGTLLRIPVRADGSAGATATRARGLGGIDDFAFAGRDETVLAALNTDSELVVVRPDGSHRVVLRREDGLSNPTSVAVRHHTVYVPSAAYFTLSDPNLLLARLSTRQGRGL
ncbi:SMP-30/gluconolactonase/LRE family protein [Streptomyces sp. NPDC014776]|uniref:SMP-30/gluconolactonase/LRE family protein n=1 Tax=Streptomyces sp. NPDC014776 TaxID=3364909 RepID=UPI0036FFB0EB